MAHYKQQFQQMIEQSKEPLYDNLSDVIPDTEQDLHKGQKVMFTNQYGYTFGAYEIFGFCRPDSLGRCVYIDKSSYWFPASPSSLTLVKEGER